MLGGGTNGAGIWVGSRGDGTGTSTGGGIGIEGGGSISCEELTVGELSLLTLLLLLGSVDVVVSDAFVDVETDTGFNSGGCSTGCNGVGSDGGDVTNTNGGNDLEAALGGFFCFAISEDGALDFT
jgi:hypothetical protein